MSRLRVDGNEPVSEREAAWNALLDTCRFSGMDEFDRSLLGGVQNGYFDPALVKERASKIDEGIKASKLDNSFFDAWRMFHDSFDDNQEDVLDAIYRAFRKGVQRISPLNLNGTVALFKALGRPGQATEMINHYVASQSEDRRLFDLRHNLFAGEVTDPDVVLAFREKYATFKNEERSPRAILLSMAETNSWSPEDITTLSTLPEEDYYEILKKTKGLDVQRVIASCLQFNRIGNATPEMREISKRATDALRRIGQESPINARRVRSYVKDYGVDLDRAEPKE